jgi:hypothetical protein
MRRMFSSISAAIAVLAFTAAVASAAVTWHSGPTVTFNGTTSVTATGDSSGLGNQPAIATLKVEGTVTYTCRNKGGAEAPGQNPVPATGTGTQDLGNSDHNGRGVLDITVSLDAPAAVVGGKVAGCPNGNWQGVNPVSSGITAATLTIEQGGSVIYGPQTFDNPNN